MKREALLWGVAATGLALMLGGVPAFALTLDGSKVLKDGRKIQIEGNRVSECVPLLNPQPKAAPAPTGGAQQCPGVWRPLKDGTYTLQGGKTIEIKNGSLVGAPKK
jgi:hypothetical protein